MGREEAIRQELTKVFAYLDGRINIPRSKRIFIELPSENFTEVVAYAAKNLGFSRLCAITGIDENEALAAVYHLADDSGVIMNIKTRVPKNGPVLNTVMPLFADAEIYERELVDLFGMRIEGLPAGYRYPLTDDWPQGEFPLRKDWKAAQGE